jgi:hypothetical protein
VYTVALMEEMFISFTSGLLAGSFSSDDLCKSIFDGGLKFIETVLCNVSFPVGESDTEWMGLSSEQKPLFREDKQQTV